MLKKVEVFFKNILLKALLVLNPPSKSSDKIVFNSNSRLLFIRLNRIGDALVTTPFLNYLYKILSCKIDLLVDRKNYFVFENADFVNNLYIFPKGLKGFSYFKRICKENKYDTVIDLHDDISATVSFLIASSPVKNKFGFSKGNDKIYTKTSEKPDSTKFHVVERALSFLSLFDIPKPEEKQNIKYKILPESISYVDDLLSRHFKNTKNNFLIGINISAGSDARFWGVERYIKLIETIADYHSNIILITADKDYEHAEKISQNSIPIFCEKDFNKFAAIVSKLNFLITPDTAIVHLASAYKIPVFGIYVRYKTSDMIWSPYASPFEYVETTEPNLENVSFESVKNKLIPFLANFIK